MLQHIICPFDSVWLAMALQGQAKGGGKGFQLSIQNVPVSICAIMSVNMAGNKKNHR